MGMRIVLADHCLRSSKTSRELAVIWADQDGNISFGVEEYDVVRVEGYGTEDLRRGEPSYIINHRTGTISFRPIGSDFSTTYFDLYRTRKVEQNELPANVVSYLLESAPDRARQILRLAEETCLLGAHCAEKFLERIGAEGGIAP